MKAMNIFRSLAAKRFLFGGKTTRRTAYVRSVASGMRGKSGIETVGNALRFVSKISRTAAESAQRNKSAEQILRENRLKGCSNAATTFATLVRSNGIPARLVDTVQKGYNGKGTFEGHVFVEVFVDRRWLTTDPMHGRIVGKGYNIKTPKGQIIEYSPFARGRDFASMGLLTTEAIRRKSAKVMMK